MKRSQINAVMRSADKFIREGGRGLIGEISMVNDDHQDNRFREPTGRFPTIEEDEPPMYLLVSDFEQYYRKFNA